MSQLTPCATWAGGGVAPRPHTRHDPRRAGSDPAVDPTHRARGGTRRTAPGDARVVASAPLAPAPGYLWPSVSVRPSTTGRNRPRRTRRLMRRFWRRLSVHGSGGPLPRRHARRWYLDLLVPIPMKTKAVGAGGKPRPRGFPSCCGRVIRVHGSDGVHSPALGDQRRPAAAAGRFFAFQHGSIQPGATPRDGCDAGTPIAPEYRGFPGGRSGLFPDPLSGSVDGSYVSALVNGTKGLRRIACDWGCDGRCDGACDRVTTIESQSSAALSVSSRTGMSVSTVVLRPPDRSQPSRVAALPDPLLAAP